MSTASERDSIIVTMATALEETLLDGVAAFREGEVRATMERAVEYAQTRHDALVAGNYVRHRGPYKGWLFQPVEALQEYPGLSSQYLATLAHDAIVARADRTVFMQSGVDSKTEQSLTNLRRTLEILNKEIHPGGRQSDERGTFEPVRTTLNRSNVFHTTTRCCR